ncbi:esterase [Gluconacetobacter liquefaciens]|uniref:Uncharacterized protein YciW n=1 Tax=Gluconacetobacter liquefaciens TaxID=89584 RepID=A0A370GAV7_GLULI|nr:hypothetical protein [Gluconacetobacter liquefaciens]MBB2185391.1 hypothetical protein [Gluconacetobacter liquefaciens]RDI40837.1 uncharacterized protein YciW [Gluconacetobacter liquefaciens]GBQ92494.1 hypothetical protein AA0522_0061 [Gluconacetobacter liquefaciens NRIC 0522]GEB39334.1 esterase [Gluconacetobacter liquefaciens]
MMDAIDAAVGLVEDDPLFARRRARAEFVTGSEACRHAVLTPADDHGLGPALRLALACRIATLNADAALAASYRAILADTDADADTRALADGASALPSPLSTIARQADLVTTHNPSASQADIAALVQVGLSNPQIVALSELIAFVNYQCRVTAGLRLLKD